MQLSFASRQGKYENRKILSFSSSPNGLRRVQEREKWKSMPVGASIMASPQHPPTGALAMKRRFRWMASDRAKRWQAVLLTYIQLLGVKDVVQAAEP